MSWTSETNIKGPKGDKGDPGIQGPPGTSGTGTGNVTGPASAVADRIAVYNGTSGTIIKDGGKTIAELGGSAASGITVTPAGNIAATNVQAALVELDNEKVAKAGDTMTGNLIVNKSNPSLALQKTASGQTNQLVGYNDVNPRWQVQMGDSVAESGSNAGSNFVVARYSDAGAPIDAPLAIARSTGVVDFKSTPTVSGVPLGSGGGTVYMQDTPPVGAPDKSMWFETDTGMLFGRYNDGNSAQWVHVPGGIADAVRYATAQSLTSAQAAQARANIWVTKKNYIINGGMMVSQENGATAGTAVGYFPVDMFDYVSSGSSAVVSNAQVASLTPGGSPNRIRATVTTADASMDPADIIYIRHRMEGLRTADLSFGTAAAKTITIQFGVRAPAGTYGIAVWNAVGNRSYTAQYIVAAGEANLDTIKLVTIPGCPDGAWNVDNTAGVVVYWTLMAGTNWQTLTPNTWVASNKQATSSQFNFVSVTTATDPNRVFELFDVSLTEGTVAPPFQLPDYAQELALCKRYWQTHTYPAGRLTLYGYNVASSTPTQSFPYEVELRATPVVTVIGTWTVSNCNQPSASGQSSKFLSLFVTVGALGAYSCSNSAAGQGVTSNARL